jgi:3',5'-cyclic AMP phosphodiesterase CpdA
MHISDLHLGNDLVWRSVLRRRSWWKSAGKEITTGLVNAIKALAPDYIVLSGDIVNKARSRQFRKAADYLKGVFQRAEFPIGRLVVVPGNHDVGMYGPASPENPKRLRRYRQFLMWLYGEDDPDAKRERFGLSDNERRVFFLGLDSTLKGGFPAAEGQVDLDWMKEELRRKTAEVDQFRSYVKIAVLHHHCMEISGTAPKKNRFMQLLNAGDVLKLLHEHEFQVVLHGHRHVPHCHPVYRSNSGVLTVIGAGTTLCIYPEEQEGWGNNFNWITVSPEPGVLCVEVYGADGTGTFVASGSSQPFPLFQVPHTGYSVETTRHVWTLSADGILSETVAKEKLRVAERGKRIAAVPFRLFASAHSARIENFNPLPLMANVADKVESISQDALREGVWRLKNSLEFGDAPITIAYTYELRQGTAMSVADYERMYQDKDYEESVTVPVKERAQHLHMEVHFPVNPRRFEVKPRLRIEAHGLEVAPDPKKVSFVPDEILNRCVLHMEDPPLEHRVSIVWTVPEDWTL